MFDGSVSLDMAGPEHDAPVGSLSLDEGLARRQLPPPPVAGEHGKLTSSPSDFDLSPVSARLLLPPRSSRTDADAAKFHWQREVSSVSPDIAFTRAPWRPGVPTHTDRALRNSAGRPLFAHDLPNKKLRSPLSSVYTSPLTVVSAPDTPPPPLDLPR